MVEAVAARMRACAAPLVALACGGPAQEAPDAPSPEVGPTVELETLDGYNHNSETSIAVSGATVVVVSINQAFDSADTFEYPATSSFRRVAVYLSTDGARTFSAPFDIQPGPEDTSDPVVRSAAGVFWIAAVVLEPATVDLWRGPGSPDAWTRLSPAQRAVWDKEWIAVRPDGEQAYVMGLAGMFSVSADGSVLGESFLELIHAVSGYTDSSGTAHFLTTVPSVVSWDGVGEPNTTWTLPPFDPVHANLWTTTGGGLGEQADGTGWIVRSERTSEGAPIVLHVRVPGASEDQVVYLTSPTSVGFLPTAASDSDGRAHAAWYDTTGAIGQLVYTHSLTSDVLGDWRAPIVIDPEACPGDRWYPHEFTPTGGRRLREYIDIAIEGNRAHLAWTHAPDPPSRVRVTTVDIGD